MSLFWNYLAKSPYFLCIKFDILKIDFYVYF